MSRHLQLALSTRAALAIHVHPNQKGQPCSQQVSGKQSDLQLQKLSKPRKPVDTSSFLEMTVQLSEPVA